MRNATRALPPRLREAGVTRREAEVLDQLADRRSNGDIATQLVISVRTVESHVSSLLSKLGATDRSELARIARSVAVGPVSSARLPLSLLELTERAPLVGRHDEMALLRERWSEAASGRRRAVLIMGEAGIGKSRLVAEVAVAADRDGAIVLVGHCDEEALVPYQPVVEAATALVETMPDHALAEVVRHSGVELLRLFPGLARFAAPDPVDDAATPEASRYRLFEGMAGLVAAARDAPLVLALEDLHWADPLTLQLIKHLVRRADRSRLLVLGTIRGTRLDGDLLRTAEDLRREHGADLLALGGLGVPEVAALVAVGPGWASDLDPGDRQQLAEHLHRETEGNPFFVVEVLRQLADGPGGMRGVPAAVGVPRTVRDVIIRRVEGLDAATRHVLSVAAVVGRRFRADLLAKVAELTQDRILAALEEAQAAGIVDEASGRPGWLAFSHALVRETLVGELSAARRVRLHRQIGEMLEAEGAAGNVAELAHHFHAAATPTDHDRAVAYCVAAAEVATAQLAHERAADLLGMALEALGLAPTVDRARTFDLLLGRAAAYRRSGLHELATEAAMEAFALARDLDDPDRVADAAFAVGDVAPVWGSDPGLVDVLEDALARVGDHDLGRRARLLGRLAQAGYYSAPSDRRHELSKEALSVARAAGDDATVAAVLSALHVALWGPTGADERLSMAEEIVAAAERLGDAEMALQGHAWRVVDLLELGEVAAADHAIARHARLARELGQPLHIRDAALWAAMRALLEGRFDDSERESRRALSLGRRAQDPHAEMFWWSQRYWLVLERGTSARDVEDLVAVNLEFAHRYPHVPAWLAKVALLHARVGDLDAAAATFAQLGAPHATALPRDAVWLGGLCFLAEVAATLDDRDEAAALYEVLLPFAGRVIVIDRAVLCLGSVSRALGLLATVVGDREAAREHLRFALEKHEAMGARPLAARTRVEFVHLLRDDEAAAAEADELLRSAAAAATELGMAQLQSQIAGTAH
jgi:DNA-binding CsgD family transcriptional regulator